VNREQDELRHQLRVLRDRRRRVLDDLVTLAWNAEQQGRAGLDVVEDATRRELEEQLMEIDADITKLDPRARWGRGE
jgi:hypothetical protein